MGDHVAHAERDEDLELALRLHRELNAVPRRQRQPVRTQAATAALKTLHKKHHRQETEESSSDESEQERSRGSTQKQRRGAGGGAPSDNDSGSKRKRQQGGGAAAARGSKPKRAGRRPQHVAAAEEARSKAASAAAMQVDGPRTHVKCFFAGLQHGTWLAAEALANRASLAAAVSRAFRDDGITCSSDAVTVVFVTPDKQTLEFPAGQPQDGATANGSASADGSGSASGAAGGEAKWEAAARSAVRVYLR